MSNEKEKKALPVYLDQEEKAKLIEIARSWGSSYSRAIARLIREANVDAT